MKKILLILLVTASFIALLGLLNKKLGFIETIETKRAKIGQTSFFVELALTEEERQKGLSGRSTLEENTGMLFSFGQEDVFPSFWMKGMLIPIDIIWIDEWEVVKIHENIQPEPEKSDGELTKYYPDGPIDLVIEVNAGFSGKNNIRVGDNVIIER